MDINPDLSKIKDCLYRVTAKAVILDGDKLLMTHEKQNDWWSLPGGGIDHGENIADALKRELREEIGVGEENIEAEELPIMVTTNVVLNGIPRMYLFYRVKISSTKVTKGEDISDLRWIKLTDIPGLRLTTALGDPAKLVQTIMR